MGNEEDIKEYGKVIERLKSDFKHIDEDFKEIKRIQEEQGKQINEYCKEGIEMSNEIVIIKNMLEEITKRRIRFVDIAIALGILITAGISAYSAMQANQVSKELLELTKRSMNIVKGG